MEYIRIKRVAEADFDGVITSAGGSRIVDPGSADYMLNEAIIELKLVEEEGFEKVERQKKLAHLFRQTQPQRPVVLVEPKHLNAADLKAYYRIVEGPIKTACKKASKQLQKTAARLNGPRLRVLVIVNIGYTLLSMDDFEDVCLKCVRNDTSGIDWVICGGIYFYSDKFDNFVISPFKDHQVRDQPAFPSKNALDNAWNTFLNDLMTDAMRNPVPAEDGQMPALDLAFESDGIRYVKPAPQIPSTFWPDGIAPRENSSGIDSSPCVAWTFPSLSEQDWRRFRKAIPAAGRLKETYGDWLESSPDEERESSNPLKPFVFVEVYFDDFARWSTTPRKQWQFSDIGAYSSKIFHQRAVSILEQAKDTEKSRIVPLEYVHLTVYEIGNDKANDFVALNYVCAVPGFESTKPLIKDLKLFWEYAMVVAASYAIKRKVNAVLYSRRRYWS
jgi:hypothetical protein